MKILVISHALIQETAQARWRELATLEGVEVTLLIPEKWISLGFSEDKMFHAKPCKEKDFEVVPCQVTNHRNWVTYRIRGLRAHIKKIQPDVIYCIHEEFIWQLHKTIFLRRFFFPKISLIYFSMHVFARIPDSKRGLSRLYRKLLWWHVRSGTDGACCHYPAIEQQMRDEQYAKPIAIQTQVGVWESRFQADASKRDTMRAQWGFQHDDCVVGSCGRLTQEKGAYDLMDALESLPISWKLLWIGDGPDKEMFLKKASDKGLSDRVFVTGRVSEDEVSHGMQALDVFVMASKSQSHWVDTFPLACAQAMMMGKPVVGSSHGAIPFQLGDYPYVYEEGNIRQLAAYIEELSQSKERRAQMGAQLHERASALFSVKAINHQFVNFIKTIQT